MLATSPVMWEPRHDASPSAPLIETRAVAKHYGAVRALTGVDFALAPRKPRLRAALR